MREVYFCSAGTWEGFEEYVFRSAQRFECRHVSKLVRGTRSTMRAPAGGRIQEKSREMWVRWEPHVTAPKSPRVCNKCYDDIGCSEELGWTGDALLLLLGISQRVQPHYDLLPSAGNVTQNLFMLIKYDGFVFFLQINVKKKKWGGGGGFCSTSSEGRVSIWKFSICAGGPGTDGVSLVTHLIRGGKITTIYVICAFMSISNEQKQL